MYSPAVIVQQAGPQIAPGTQVWFAVPVTNNTDRTVTCKVTGHLHQGATMGTGSFMRWPNGTEARFESSEQSIDPGQTVTLGLPGGDQLWTTQDIGGDPERDLTDVILHYQDEEGNWVEDGSTENYGIYQVTPSGGGGGMSEMMGMMMMVVMMGMIMSMVKEG